jgi:hypothetical protein
MQYFQHFTPGRELATCQPLVQVHVAHELDFFIRIITLAGGGIHLSPAFHRTTISAGSTFKRYGDLFFTTIRSSRTTTVYGRAAIDIDNLIGSTPVLHLITHGHNLLGISFRGSFGKLGEAVMQNRNPWPVPWLSSYRAGI